MRLQKSTVLLFMDYCIHVFAVVLEFKAVSNYPSPKMMTREIPCNIDISRSECMLSY